MNNNSLHSLTQYLKDKALRKPLLYKPEDMFCKSFLLPIFEKELCTNPSFVFNEDKNVIFIIDENDERIHTKDYYTAAYLALMRKNCKLSFGKPSDLISFEDIILSTPLS